MTVIPITYPRHSASSVAPLASGSVSIALSSIYSMPVTCPQLLPCLPSPPHMVIGSGLHFLKTSDFLYSHFVTKKFQRPSNLFTSCRTENPNHSLENRNSSKHLFSGFHDPPTSLLSGSCNPLSHSLSPLRQLISSWKERAILFGFH